MADTSESGTEKSSKTAAWLFLVLIAMVGVVGVLKWKQGSDRVGCLHNQRNVQIAVRSYGGMNNMSVGQPLDWSQIIGPGKFMEKTPVCPCGGVYKFSTTNPPVGTLAMECSLSGAPENHVPPGGHTDW